MKKKKLISAILLLIGLSVANSSAEQTATMPATTPSPLNVYTKDGVEYMEANGIVAYARDGRYFIRNKNTPNVTFALFHLNGNRDFGYAAFSLFPAATGLATIHKGGKGTSLVPAEKWDSVLFQIYSQINIDEILSQIKNYPEQDFNAVFSMLYLISEHVATITDKRKIMDFFLERFDLKIPPAEMRKRANRAFYMQWQRFYSNKEPLTSCLTNYAVEYADQPPPALTNNLDLQRSSVFMLQNHIYASPDMLKSVDKPNVPADVKISYYIYSKSILGTEVGITVPETRFSDLKKELGDAHPGIRTAEIQASISAGDFRPEFAEELRGIVDKNYDIALTIALEYARKTAAWDDAAYYAYRCLKHDVYGIQKQSLNGPRLSPYFEYLEFLLEGLSKTDPQEAGTVYEFIRALPKNTQQNFWLVHAERILAGIVYDKALAEKAGAEFAKKGFYENAKFEKRFRESLEKRVENN